MKAEFKTIPEYNAGQITEDSAICELLKSEIERGLPKATSKIWHGHPVWFLDGNPIVGYHRLKKDLRLMFWSGQSFDEPELKPEGTFKAAEIRFSAANDVDVAALRRWLSKSEKIQWDYKNIVKNRGLLERL